MKKYNCWLRYLFPLPNEHWMIPSAMQDNRVKKSNNNKCYWCRLIPLITNSAIEVEQVLNGIVGDGDENDVEADDDQRADGEVGDDS